MLAALHAICSRTKCRSRQSNPVDLEWLSGKREVVRLTDVRDDFPWWAASDIARYSVCFLVSFLTCVRARSPRSPRGRMTLYAGRFARRDRSASEPAGGQAGECSAGAPRLAFDDARTDVEQSLQRAGGGTG